VRWHRRWRPVVDGATGPVLAPLRAPQRRALAMLLRQIVRPDGSRRAR